MTNSAKPALDLPRDPGAALSAAYQFGEGLLEVVAEMARGLLSPRVLNPSMALNITGNPAGRVIDTLGLLLSGSSLQVTAEQFANKSSIFILVPAVSGLIGVPPAPPLPLQELVARSYALGDFFSLWAIEGLGHDYGDSAWQQGAVPSRILAPEVARTLPEGSLPMLHAGIGLSFAQRLLDDLRWNTPSDELRRKVAEIARLDEDNALPGYVGAAYESLGLVSRTFHPTEVADIDQAVRAVAPEMRGYFWHGVGRAIYFWVFNFLPCSDWEVFRMARREAPDEEARLNAFAGAAWAYALVNQRQPRIMAELLIRPHGEELARDGGFANGIASSMMMRYDTTPDAPFIQPFLQYRPNPGDRRLAELWDHLVRIPAETALREVYPALRQQGRMGEIFEYRDLRRGGS